MKKSHRNNAENKKQSLQKKTEILRNLKKHPNKITTFFKKNIQKTANKHKKEIPIKKTRKERNITKTPKTLIWYFVHIKKRAKKYKRELKKSSSNN